MRVRRLERQIRDKDRGQPGGDGLRIRGYEESSFAFAWRGF
jgi:hypothetical protein